MLYQFTLAEKQVLLIEINEQNGIKKSGFIGKEFRPFKGKKHYLF